MQLITFALLNPLAKVLLELDLWLLRNSLSSRKGPTEFFLVLVAAVDFLFVGRTSFLPLATPVAATGTTAVAAPLLGLVRVGNAAAGVLSAERVVGAMVD
jgi:hypothetical protein